MDQNTKGQITNKLRGFLNREPSESEIENAQNDHHIMDLVIMDRINSIEQEIASLKGKNMVK